MKRVLCFIAPLMLLFSCVEAPKIEFLGSIDGFVIDSKTEQPIQNATVKLTPGGGILLTDKNGRFQFVSLTPREYTVSATYNGYETVAHQLVVRSGIASKAQFSLNQNYFSLSSLYTILDFGYNKYHIKNTLTNNTSTPINYSISIVEGNEWIEVGKAEGTVINTEDINVFVSRESLSPNRYKGKIAVVTDYGELQIPVYMDVQKGSEPTIAQITTSNADADDTNAVLHATINSIGNVAEVEYYGHIWSTEENPSFSNGQFTKFEHAFDAIDFSSNASGLEPSTKYYYRAYAVNKVGTSYGDVRTFTTRPVECVAVDLGLPSGTKWANLNIGAKNEKDLGSCFQWGAISTTDKTNPCRNVNKSIKQTNNDAAFVLWGEDWSIPSIKQVEELLRYTTPINNGDYYMLKSVVNGKNITFPNKGYYYSNNDEFTVGCIYWTSDTSCNEAYRFGAPFFFNDSIYRITKNCRLPIRPVTNTL